MNPYYLARPLLFRLDPEKAHDLTLGALARFPTIMNYQIGRASCRERV